MTLMTLNLCNHVCRLVGVILESLRRQSVDFAHCKKRLEQEKILPGQCLHTFTRDNSLTISLEGDNLLLLLPSSIIVKLFMLY